MELSPVFKNLPTFIIKHIFSFDRRIVIRKGVLHFINRFNKKRLLWDFEKIIKMPRIYDSHTTVYKGIITTEASVVLKNGFPETYTLEYRTRNEKRVCIIFFWRGEDDNSRIVFEMP